MDRSSVVDYFRVYENFHPNIIERELKVPLKSESIITIIGPRRAGKSFYFFQLMKTFENALYLDFDDFRLHNIKYNEIDDVIKIYSEIYGAKPKTLFLDEIQEIDNWELTVRTFHDLKSHKIFITGSSSKMFSKEISTHLRGRTLSYLLLPFSFREFLKALKIDFPHNPGKEKISEIKRQLRQYLEFGGFPNVVLENEKIDTLKEYSDLILFKDLIERHKVKNTSLARFLHESIIQNFAREVSVNSMFEKSKTMGLKTTKRIVYEYINSLQDTVFFFFIERYSKKPHVRASWPKKAYLADTGLTKIAKFSEDIGLLMENAVFLELSRKKNLNKLLEIYYWKESNSEVDFVTRESGKITNIIQVTYELNEHNTKREIEALIKASEALKCNNLTIITWDREGTISNKIKLIPLWKWLTEPIKTGFRTEFPFS